MPRALPTPDELEFAPGEYLAAYYDTDEEARVRELLGVLRGQLSVGAPERAQLVTQHNSLAVVGLEPRRFLEVIRILPDLTVLELGKVRAVRADELIAALGQTRTCEPASEVQSQASRLARAAGLG